MATALKRGWILTGVYCAATITPGLSAVVGFFAAWGAMMIIGPTMMLAQFAISNIYPVAPDWLATTLAVVTLVLLIPVPTFVNAWRMAERGQRGAAVIQVALMWLIVAMATVLAAQSLQKAWR